MALLSIPDDVKKAAAERAAGEGWTVNDVVTGLLRDYIAGRAGPGAESAAGEGNGND